MNRKPSKSPKPEGRMPYIGTRVKSLVDLKNVDHAAAELTGGNRAEFIYRAVMEKAAAVNAGHK